MMHIIIYVRSAMQNIYILLIPNSFDTGIASTEGIFLTIRIITLYLSLSQTPKTTSNTCVVTREHIILG